jgi:hypothetical protein
MSGALLTEVVEGWTGALPFRLNADGDPVNLTGTTVSIILKDCEGAVIKDSTSGVAVTSSTGGLVAYTPSSSEFVATRSPYKVRFQVATTSARVFFPNGDEDLIGVNAR